MRGRLGSVLVLSSHEIACNQLHADAGSGHHLHGVALKEVLELLLGGCVGKVADVQATALVSAGGSSVGRLRGRGSTVGAGSVVNGGRSHGVGDSFNGRHLEGELRHGEGSTVG